MLTIKYSLAILTACAVAGIGFFISGGVARFFKKSESVFSWTVALLFFCAGFVSLLVMVGNPSKLFNILSNLSSGFSMMTIGIILMIVISAAAINTTKKSDIFFYITAGLGILVAVYLFYGLVLMFVKPSRMALNSWHVPMFMFASALALGGCSSGNKLLRLSGLVLEIAAVSGFLLHLSSLEVADRYLSMELLMTDAKLLLFGGVIATGIAIPILLELIKNRTKILDIFETFAIFAGSVSFLMIINIAISRTGNMV